MLNSRGDAGSGSGQAVLGQQVVTVSTPRPAVSGGTMLPGAQDELSRAAADCCAGLLERNWAVVDDFLGAAR